VDYRLRAEALEELERRGEKDLPGLIDALLRAPGDGRLKLFLTHRCLQFRRRFSRLFQTGDYAPVPVEGRYRDHVVAFSRRHGTLAALVVAPRFLTGMIEEGTFPLGEALWQDTVLRLPEGLGPLWREIFSGETVEGDGLLPVGRVLRRFPVGLLRQEKNQSATTGAVPPEDETLHP
jgi:(1->4)-alpha-D-glucan 1-alpha-D-glucosylmutase